jgi:hypothetical protein
MNPAKSKFKVALRLLPAIALLLAAILACKSSGAATNRALENLLDASTDKEFNNQFYIHGSIREEEVPAIYEATKSTGPRRRRNAASLLCATVKGNAVELQHKVVVETKDVQVWAIELDCVLEKDESMAGQRPDMIKAALEDANPNTLAVGLRAAALSNYPGTRELARKYLDHHEA